MFIKYFFIIVCFFPSFVYLYFFQQRMEDFCAQGTSWKNLAVEYREERKKDKWLQQQRGLLPVKGEGSTLWKSLENMSFHVPAWDFPLEQEMALCLYNSQKEKYQLHFQEKEVLDGQGNEGCVILYAQRFPVVLWEHEFRPLVKQIEQTSSGVCCTKCSIKKCEEGVSFFINARQNVSNE